MRTACSSAILLTALILCGCSRKPSVDPLYETYQPVSGTPAQATPDSISEKSPAATAPASAPTSTPAAANAASQPQPIVTIAQGIQGKISSVNSNLRFVVVTFPLGQMAKIDQRLSVYRAGLKVGELVVTPPQREDSTVADITTGEAQVGDEVRDQ